MPRLICLRWAHTHFVGFVISWSEASSRSIYEPQHDKTNKMACPPSEDSDQPGHPPNLIRVFAVRMKKKWVLGYPLSAQRRLWSDWADAQADLNVRWAHMSFCWFCRAAAHIVCANIEGSGAP